MLNPLKWFSNEALDEFARGLAREFADRYPQKLASEGGKKSELKLAKALDHVYAESRRFRDAERLGVYGKARLGNTFKWALEELGYDKSLVEDVTKGLIIKVASKSG